MPANYIPFKETGYFSTLICDYLDQYEPLRELYGQFPGIEEFGKQLEEKKESYTAGQREVLVTSLRAQYADIQLTDPTANHLDLLENKNTFTIVTGHQLNLFTGPLYFLYKIISTINLCKRLKQAYPENNFVPVYWMATEDHDFEEINYFNYKGKKFQWQGPENAVDNNAGAVGRIETNGLEEVFELFNLELGQGKAADTLRELFTKAYLQGYTLSKATRLLVNELFGNEGLVILDGDDAKLKSLFIPVMEKELKENFVSENVAESNAKLNDIDGSYKIQVNPREINLFYLDEGLRERIIETENKFLVNNSDLEYSKEELLDLLHTSPEKFSPNVLMRPMFQEVILPNLCYIGGGGELAYWLQLKKAFHAASLVFPVLLLRNSVLIKEGKQAEKLEKLHISDRQLFLNNHSFINKKVREISDIDIDFTPQRELLKEQFRSMYELAEKTDASFLGAVKAQEVKQLKGLDHLEKRLLKAQKRKLSDEVNRMMDLRNALFPGDSLQERTANFSEFYETFEDALIPTLLQELDPLRADFVVLTL
ncbi:bacillithiol biosynthesis cysteine-adding enzyme BshC [Robertkochia solimangrovi]|uniref:bacillithiol biosynthesis cysteine-adding enzyme BshC n=1 Tax=Robertkochia solimangrovi TaxID=2213046 RepID=UPI001180BE14|nr:bacillithiol biosynthesis cysteine-adding enzyme BshC [Robertkochia solimangrovi]TRZ41823.1 bacillithiol biosynthesis cysteine-adding enzyme BshC [Robertkochia solimangrovi]